MLMTLCGREMGGLGEEFPIPKQLNFLTCNTYQRYLTPSIPLSPLFSIRRKYEQ